MYVYLNFLSIIKTCAIIYFAIGCPAMYSVASSILKILSASASGISIANSSSIAMTTSTESRESSPRSSLNLADGDTFAGSTLSKFLTTFTMRSVTSPASMKV